MGSRLKRVFDCVRGGMFGDVSLVLGVLDALQGGSDHYVVCFDFYSYIEAQERVD